MTVFGRPKPGKKISWNTGDSDLAAIGRRPTPRNLMNNNEMDNSMNNFRGSSGQMNNNYRSSQQISNDYGSSSQYKAANTGRSSSSTFTNMAQLFTTFVTGYLASVVPIEDLQELSEVFSTAVQEL